MPSWGIHLVTANEILKNTDITDKNAFLMGNFIPDAARHVIKDFSIFVPYDTSHFAELQAIEGNLERLPNPNKFTKKYKKNIKNPLILGYLIHLLTDYYWNKVTATRYTIRDKNGNCIAMILNNGNEIKADKNIRRNLKHNDFYLFEEELIRTREFILPIYQSNLLQYILDIEETKYNEKDFIKIVNYLNNKFGATRIEKQFGNYKLFTKEQMKIDYDNSIKFILKFLLENDLITK